MLLALSESSSHVSARRKTQQPPSRPSGGAEGDSPLGWDAEGAAGGPSGPLHGSSAGITTQSCGRAKHNQTCDFPASERVNSFFKEQLSEKRGGGGVLSLSLSASGRAPVVGVHACVLHRTGGKSAQDLQGSFFPSGWRRRSRSAGRARRGPWTVAGW